MEHLRVLRPAEGVLAFYEGREPGHRFAEGRNWVDEGALGLGIASYAIVDGGHGLVYDTHVSVDRAAFIRETLLAEGVADPAVVLSHWHLDHVAGTAAFPDAGSSPTSARRSAWPQGGRRSRRGRWRARRRSIRWCCRPACSPAARP